MINIEEVNKNGRLLAWHGAQKWEGLPEIKPHKKGTYEYGPGIYFTNHCSTAQSYARGPGSIMLMEIECPRLLTIKDKVLLEDATSFYDSCFRLKNRKSILNDLKRNVRDGFISVDTVINCGVNNEALAGSHGPDLAQWLADKGFDATIGRSQANNEEWMVVFNPKIIKKYKKMRSAEIDWNNSDFPRFSSQIEKIELDKAIDLDPILNNTSINNNRFKMK